ncbi:MAG: response regulator [Acidobacteriota bacterium]
MKNILVLDDDPVILEIIKSELDQKKYNIFLASNGVEGLELLNTKKIDILITDLLMPEFDGIQLISYMKENQINIPVLVITSVEDTDIIDQVMNLGIKNILKKPIDFKELEKKINLAEKSNDSFEKKLDLLSLCKLFAMEKRSSEISVIKGGINGSLCLKKGQIFYAEFGNITGKDAIEELFSLSDIKIELKGNCKRTDSNITENDRKYISEKFFSSGKKKQTDLDISIINNAFSMLNKNLGKELLATELWDANSIQSVAGFSSDQESKTFFHAKGEYLNKIINQKSFPELDDFFIFSIKKKRLILILLFENYRWGLMVNRKSGTMGVLLSIVIPGLKKAFNSATT